MQSNNVIMGRYEVYEGIGEGSFGKVYRGKERMNNEPVAIKMISKATTMFQLESWQSEFEIQKALRHPNIIRMLDAIETPDFIFLVTEQARGDIYKLFIRNGPLPLPKVQVMAYNLVSALYYLHDNRILHRDLKPQNILIGYDGLPKLCDFGFARRVDINTYMLTSFKGTPLYMAPEIVQEQPYDQNADLWSLGCILYELCVGEPPFPPSALIQFGRKFQLEPVHWPDIITGSCKSFLEGLLEKDAQKRLSWPHLLDHPFIHTFLLDTPMPEDQFSLTKALSPSQELAKENQRQTLQKRLGAYAKLFNKPTKKESSAQKQLKDFSFETRLTKEMEPTGPEIPNNNDDSDNSSVESLTSSSSSLTSDGRTVIYPRSPGPALPNEASATGNNSSKKLQETISAIQNLHLDERSSSRLYDILWISERLYNVHSGDKPIETEEWCIFVGKTMQEVKINPNCLCDKHFLSVLIAPLGNHLAEVRVIENIASLLAMPFAFNREKEELKENLENIYFAGKVLPNLVYACKLMVRRRLLEKISLKSGESVDLMTVMKDEDLFGMDKCMRLISFLIHVKKEFVEQFCECVCRFKIFPIIYLFLRSYERRMRLTVETLTVLSHIMRAAGWSSKFKEFMSDYEDNSQEINTEIFHLMSHADPNVQSRAIRLMGSLMTYSESVRQKLVCPNVTELWNILTQASNHADSSISSAAEFTSGQLEQLVPFKSQSEVNRVQD